MHCMRARERRGLGLKTFSRVIVLGTWDTVDKSSTEHIRGTH